jgi:hypothetical protein
MVVNLTNLPPREAIEYFKQKGFNTDHFSWKDAEIGAHQNAFMVAKVMELDVLRDIRDEIQKSLESGETFEQFQANLEPKLFDKGWLGMKEVIDPKTGERAIVQLDRPTRLRLIYNTNLRSSHVEGQWARIQENKRTFPYLAYDANNSQQPRIEHSEWDNLALQVDDPFWQNHYPPKGFNCKCRVYSMTRSQYENNSDLNKKEPQEKLPILWTNDRTGEKQWLPEGVNPSFNYPPGGYFERIHDLYRDRLSELPSSLRKAVLPYQQLEQLQERFPFVKEHVEITNLSTANAIREFGLALNNALLKSSGKSFLPVVDESTGFGLVDKTFELWSSKFKINKYKFASLLTELYTKNIADLDINARRLSSLLKIVASHSQWKDDYRTLEDLSIDRRKRYELYLKLVDMNLFKS